MVKIICIANNNILLSVPVGKDLTLECHTETIKHKLTGFTSVINQVGYNYNINCVNYLLLYTKTTTRIHVRVKMGTNEYNHTLGKFFNYASFSKYSAV